MDYKNIACNFFQLVPTRAKTDEEYKLQFKQLGDALRNIDKLNVPLSRSEDLIAQYGEIDKKGSLIFGTLVKVQMTNIPPSFTPTTQMLNPLNLTEDQGLGFPTSFMFDPEVNILMIESVRDAVGTAAFCRLIMQNMDIPAFEAAIVINPADLEKFYNMTSITKFEVRIAKLENGSIFQESGKKSVNQIISSADKTNTDVLEYKLSTSRTNPSLSVSRVKGFVKDLLGYKETEEVKMLKITGKEIDDERAVPIDFIKQRLRGFISMEKQRLIGNFYIKEKYEKMAELYNKHRSGLISAYRSNR